MRRLLRFAILGLISVPAIVAQSSGAVRVGEDGIRKSAYKTVMPGFPKDSKKRRAQGVAVVELEYDGMGNVTRARVLEAPDSEIARVVATAVGQWKFRGSTIRGEPINVRGKLTFYYVIERDGQGHVKNPKQFQKQ